MLSFVSACADVSATIDEKTWYCAQGYEPVYLTQAEINALRPKTLLTIDANNAVWYEECD